MGIVFRQSAKSTIVVAMGALLGVLIIWLSTAYNTKQQLGFTKNLVNYALAVSQLLLLGLHSTLVVFIHKYADNERKRKLLISLAVFIPTLVAVVFTVGYAFCKAWILKHFQPADIPFMERYFMWLPVYTLLFVYMLVFEQYLGSQMKVAISAFMREVVLRVANIILLLLFGFGYVNFDVLVIGTVLIYLLPVSLFLILSFRIKEFGFSFDFRSFSKEEYKEIVHFSWYHFLLSISFLMMSYMDALTLPFYDHSGFSSLAVYSVAVLLISFMQLPSKALMPASFTVLAKAFNDNDMDKAKDIFVRASINIFIPSVAMALILICNLGNAVAVIKNGYGEIVPVFLILFIGRLFDLATGMNDQVLSIAKYYKFNFYLSLILMVFLFLMIRFLVPRYGIYGAAWSTTITLVFFNIAKFLFVWKKLAMQPFSSKTILVLIAAIPALAAGYFFPHFFDQGHHVYIRSFMDAVLRSLIVVIVYALMLLWLKPSNDLQEYIATIRKDKRLF